MESKLFNMLSDLAKSPKKQQELNADPEAVMTRYGLSKKQITLLKSAYKRNRQQDLYKALGDEIFDKLKFLC